MYKKVKYLIPAYDVDMGGIMVKQALPTNNVNQVDPFLLLHHGKFTYTKNAPAIQQGLGPHPHRGFSPITFVIDGEVHHRDSRGNKQIAKKGEVQWMHAGAGIIHSERPSQALTERNGTLEIVQLWINSPAGKKMHQPKYQYMPVADIPVFYSTNKGVSNKLVSGSYNGQKSQIVPESDLLIIWSESKKGGSQNFSIPEQLNAMLYVIHGGLKIKGYGIVEKESLVVFEYGATDIELSVDPSTQLLLLCGTPINEKVVQHGPFVMNSETEILQAMRDYQMGKMGVLIEEH